MSTLTQRKQSFWYTVLLVSPFVLSFVTATQFGARLGLNRLNTVVICTILIVYLFDKKNRSQKEVYSCLKFFALFAFYMAIVGIWNGKYIFFSLILILSTTFSFAFLGYEFRRYSIVGYVYACVAAIIALDFAIGGITAGFNTNIIAMFAINGVMFICLVNDMQGGRFFILNAIAAVILSLLINVTGCRSVFIALFVCLVLRYILFARKRLSKWFYRIVCIVAFTAPYWVMQIYLSLYNGSSRDSLNKFFLEQTGKVLFTEREVIWQDLFRRITGEYYWFGYGVGVGNAHNLCMDIWYSFGLIGCIFYAVLFLMILFRLYKHIGDPIIKSSVCCFLGLIASETFECAYFTIATQNTNIILYLFIAIALGRYTYLEQRQKRLKQEEALYEA